MPTGHGVRVDDEQAARPHGPRTSKGNPESPFRVFERWAWALFLQRRHLLPQSNVLQHQVGAAPTHRPNGTDDVEQTYAIGVFGLRIRSLTR